MEKFPLEIWQRVFQLLSHRNKAICSRVCKLWHQHAFHPNQYTTLEISSPSQLRKFIKVAKQIYLTTTNHYQQQQQQQQPMIYFVQHIVLYYGFERDEDYTFSLLTEFPNLQSIKTTEIEDYTTLYIKKAPPYPNWLKDVPFWFRIDDKEWMISFDKRKLTSLEYMIYHLDNDSNNNNDSNDDNDDNDNGTLLYLQKIGPIKKAKPRYARPIYHNNNNNNGNSQEEEEELISYQSKILILPTFYYLTSLKIAFIQGKIKSRLNHFELDERTLQSIHQSCQQLVTLHLYEFNMNISEDYIDHYDDDEDDDKKREMILPSNTLKSLKVTGIFYDHRCYEYLMYKYPILETFDYTAHHYSFKKEQFPLLQGALYKMMTQLQYLNRLSIKTLQVGISFHKFWPNYEWIQWLNDHPHQFLHIDYPECLFPITSDHVNSNNKNDLIHLNIPTMNHNSMVSNGFSSPFLNHLTSLSMRSKLLLETATNYLLLNKDTIILSPSIKELKVYEVVGFDLNDIYLLDWLDILPHLHTFRSVYQNIKGDEEEEEEIKVKYTYFGEDGNENDEGNHQDHTKNHHHYNLHSLIKQRKKQYGIKDGFYSLRTLELKNGTLRIKNGFTSLFKRFNKLNQLILNDMKYISLEQQQQQLSSSSSSSTLPEGKKIQIFMNHLYLDYVCISGLWIVPWKTKNENHRSFSRFFNKTSKGNKKTKIRELMVTESSSSTCKKYLDQLDSTLINENIPCLHLYCYYLDQLVFFDDYY